MKKETTFLIVFFATLCLSICINANAQGRIDLGKASASEVVLHSSDFNGFSSTFSFNSIESNLVTNEKGEFNEIFIDGSFPYGEEGSPQLPMITRLIAIPDGATPIVNVGSYSETEYRLSDYGIGKIAPMQAPVRKDTDLSSLEYKVNEDAYSRNSYNTDEIASVEYLGTIRGLSIGKLTVRPVRYNPAIGTVKVFNDIDVKVKFENGDATSTETMFANTYSPAFNSIYDQIFNIGMLMDSEGKDAYTDHPDPYHTPVRMLVICYSGFKNNSSLSNWLKWKLQKGYYVDIFYTDQSGTTAGAIASFIKSKYNASVSAGNAYSYLITIGDTEQIPYYNTSSIDFECAFDIGYSSVDFTTNTSDYFPDMLYSRISVENTTQLDNYINKVLTYEKFEFSDGGDFLNNVILVGGYDQSGWTNIVGRPTINYATNNYFNSSNTTYGGFGNGTINATISTATTPGYSGSNNGCYNGINNGACFINYTAHGHKQEWSQPLFTTSHVASLSNTGKYFFAIGNCCLTGNYNNTQTYYDPGTAIGSKACFAEAMIRVPNAGAIAYIGCSPYSYWYEDFYWACGAHPFSSGNAPSISSSTMGVYDAMFTDQYWNSASSLNYLGNLAVQSACDNNYQISTSLSGANAKYYFKFYHTFGDGSVMPYITKPETNTVTMPGAILPSSTSMTVHAVAGSYVAVTNNTNTIYGVGLANSSGVATVNFTNAIPNSGTLHVVVTRQQYKPYFGIVTISNTAHDCDDVTHEFSVSACESYTWNEQTYTQSGNYIQTFPITSGNIVGEEFFYDFDNNPDPNGSFSGSGWLVFNTSTDTNDTENWDLYMTEGVGYNNSDYFLASPSYVNNTDIAPDHWICLPPSFIGTNSVLSFYAKGYSNNYAAEHFGVYVTTNSNFQYISDFTLIHEWTTNNSWSQYSFDLGNYAGQNVIIALRHFDCFGQYLLLVDDIRLSNGNAKANTEDIIPTRNCDSIVTLHLTINTPPTVTIDGTATIGTGGQTTLTASGASTYVWNTGATTASINVSPTTTTTYTVTGTDVHGCTGTAQFTVTIDGIEEDSPTVSVFPNPVEQVVTVKASNIERIRLFDITGQMIFDSTEKGDTATIDMSGFANGQYILQIRTKNNVVTQKLIKK